MTSPNRAFHEKYADWGCFEIEWERLCAVFAQSQGMRQRERHNIGVADMP